MIITAYELLPQKHWPHFHRLDSFYSCTDKQLKTQMDYNFIYIIVSLIPFLQQCSFALHFFTKFQA